MITTLLNMLLTRFIKFWTILVLLLIQLNYCKFGTQPNLFYVPPTYIIQGVLLLGTKCSLNIVKYALKISPISKWNHENRNTWPNHIILFFHPHFNLHWTKIRWTSCSLLWYPVWNPNRDLVTVLPFYYSCKVAPWSRQYL